MAWTFPLAKCGRDSRRALGHERGRVVVGPRTRGEDRVETPTRIFGVQAVGRCVQLSLSEPTDLPPGGEPDQHNESNGNDAPPGEFPSGSEALSWGRRGEIIVWVDIGHERVSRGRSPFVTLLLLHDFARTKNHGSLFCCSRSGASGSGRDGCRRWSGFHKRKRAYFGAGASVASRFRASSFRSVPTE